MPNKEPPFDKPHGLCRICGKYGELTLEHVPPHSAFNDRPMLVTKFDEWEKGQGGEYYEDGYARHLLCGKCNNETGGNYGTAFAEWCRQGFELIHATLGKSSANYHGVIYPLRVLKQIAVIFFDTAAERYHQAHPELVKFVLDKDAKGLPAQYRFHVFWYGGGSIRSSSVTGAVDLYSGRISLLSEFVWPPFGYILSFDSDLFDRRPHDISYFANYGYNEAITFNRRLPVLPTHWVLPGDYRTVEQFARTMRTNDLLDVGHPEPEAVVEFEEQEGLLPVPDFDSLD